MKEPNQTPTLTDLIDYPGEPLGLPGGPAFPVSIPGVGDNGCAGMSLRDWFAGMAIATVINKSENSDGGWHPATVAVCCYAVADAMLEERKSRGEG